MFQGLRTGLGWPWPGSFGWVEEHGGNVQIFLEAIGLEEVGEFEGPHIAASVTDFPLQITDDALELLRPVAEPEQFKPHALASKAQAELLSGQLAIELMGLEDLLWMDWAHISQGRVRFATQERRGPVRWLFEREPLR